FGGVVPAGKVDPAVAAHVEGLYASMGEKMENGDLRSATEDMVTLIQYANKYYDDQKPWVQAKAEDLTDFGNTTATCIYLMANMANLFAPVIPEGCEKLAKVLNIEKLSWTPVTLPETFTLGEVPILYTRIDEPKN
ncbi:MAG: hypothetical protein IJW62_08765, partial [Clostridia bacterium]|nr:hypothetical protein [Clostridia bacterium]